jgi:hypothetical protein
MVSSIVFSGVWQKHWPAIASFGVSFGVYILTLCPSVYVEGSGELIGATYLLGTPHPTGYPLFALVGRLISAPLSPPFSPAYSINLASALLASAAAAALAGLLRSRGHRAWICVGAALSFAFSSTFWSQAVIAEVYSLSMCAVLAVYAATLAAFDRRDERFLLLAAFLFGLGVTAHLNQVLVLPGIGLLFLWGWIRGGVRWRMTALCSAGLCALIGYSIVLYLPIRNGLGSGFHWGPLQTPQLLYEHLTAAAYTSSFTVPPNEVVIANLNRWLGQMVNEFHVLLSPLILWGAIEAWRRDKALAVVTLCTVFINLVAVLTYHRDPNGMAVFSLVSLLSCGLLLAFGMESLSRHLQAVRTGRRGVPLFLIGLLVPLLVVSTNHETSDLSDSWIPHRYGADILAQLPPRAILLTEGDDASFILDYLHRVEGLRPDVDLYNRVGRGTDLVTRKEGLLDPWEQARLRREREAVLVSRSIADRSSTGRPVFFLVPRSMPAKGYSFSPRGLAYGVVQEGEEDLESIVNLDMTTAEMETASRDPWVQKIQANYWFMLGEQFSREGRHDRARLAYERGAEVAPRSRTMHYNVAIMLLKQNKLDAAWRHLKTALDLDPLRPEVYRLGANILRRQGRFDDADELLKRALKLRRIP